MEAFSQIFANLFLEICSFPVWVLITVSLFKLLIKTSLFPDEGIWKCKIWKSHADYCFKGNQHCLKYFWMEQPSMEWRQNFKRHCFCRSWGNGTTDHAHISYCTNFPNFGALCKKAAGKMAFSKMPFFKKRSVALTPTRMVFLLVMH